MKLRHYFPAILAVAIATASRAELPEVKPEEKVPEIKLPIEKPRNVATFDLVKAKAAVPWDLQVIKLPEAHAKNPAARGKGIRIAILDTGCQVDHPGLEGRVVLSYNAITKRTGAKEVADGNNHGTWCTGAVHDVVPEADLIVVKVLSDSGSGRVDVIAHGIDYAVTVGKADVISLSLGGPQPDQFQAAAIKRAVEAGVVVIAAAGNEGGPGDTQGWPSRFPECIAVASSNQAGRLSSFSSWGPTVFTVDPGEDVENLLPGNRVGLMSGTSMSTPKTAGKCASWIASNAIPKDANRTDKFRKVVIEASPFKERNNARGHGLFTLDKITGEAKGVTPVPTPGKPVSVTITLDDLSQTKREELRLGGVTKFRLEVGHTERAEAPLAVPVQQVPRPAGTEALPVPGVWVPPAQPWYHPIPQTVPQVMPGPCPGGVCPAPVYYPPQPQGWTPGTVIRRVLR
jgi:hypothetical protein